jgi:hypothetical protein
MEKQKTMEREYREPVKRREETITANFNGWMSVYRRAKSSYHKQGHQAREIDEGET